MVRLREDEDTINFSERIFERRQGAQLPKLQNSPEVDSKVTITRIENFTCPACKEVCGTSIAVNGWIRGWCGNTHTYVEVNVPKLERR